MPFGTEGVEPGIGLALSGFGFRAVLFHCGVLWRLNELAYIPKLTRVSSVSGGSIAAGRLAVRWHALQFTAGVARTHLVLTDGGVSDCLGTEPIRERLDTVLVSDGGAPFRYISHPGRDWIRQTLRALDVMTRQAHSSSKRRLLELFRLRERKGAYWGIMTEIAAYKLPSALTVPADTTATLARTRARLNPLTEAEQCSLINWGYAVCDAAMRRFVDAHAAPPAGWPYPDYALDRSAP
jgi:hypothetical protein